MSKDSAISPRGFFGRLYHGETSFDFVGKSKIGFTISIILILLTLGSFFTRGLNLGIDFKGGVAWQVPSSETMDVDTARAVLEDNGVPTDNAKVQTFTSGATTSIRIQVGDQSAEVRAKVQSELATQAAVDINEVSVSSVSSSWGRAITEKAIRALIVFMVLVGIYIAWRFEWRMAIAAILAMLHDVLISVGLYSIIGFEVTPATVVAFLTILGFSLYDTIVVFDRINDNIEKFGVARTSMANITNVSMNQVLMRSLNTSLAAVLPVLSLLVLGSGVFGAISLREFAIALLVGLLIGSYSSIFIATPLLCIFKERETRYKNLTGVHATGAELAHMVTSGGATGAKSVRRQTDDAEAVATVPQTSPTSTALLNHPPRPRKKRRRSS